jgi:hypothetical protein
MKMIFKAAAAATFLAIAPASAHASTIMINAISFDTPGYRTGKITHTPTSTTLNNVGIGRLKLGGVDLSTMSAVQYLTYCVDIFHYLHTGTFAMPQLSTYVTNPVKLGQLTTLVGNANAQIALAGTAVARKDASAAAQLAVWEIVFEGGGAYDLAAGDFSVTNGDSGNARTLANTWLNNVTGGSWTRIPRTELGFLFNQTNQSQIFLNAVPEPASWAMLLAGFGFIGSVLRRSSRRRAMPLVLA